MSIVRTQKGINPFVQIDSRVFEDNRISWKAKGLLGYLLSKPDNWKVLIDDIVKKSPDGITSIRGALKELKENGYADLELIRDDDSGQINGKGWVIFEQPKHRHTENPDVGENRKSGNPKVGKSTTSNNNLSNNKKKSKNKPLQEINTCEEVKEMPFNIQAKAKVKELIPDYYFDENYDWKALTEIDYYLVNYLQAQEEILGTKIAICRRLEAFEVLIRHVLEKEKWFTFDLSGINKNKNKFWNACKSDLGKQLKSDNWDDFMAKHYLDRDIPQFNSVYQRNNILADLTRDIVSRLRAIGEIDKAIVIEMQYQKVDWEELYKLALNQVKFTQTEYEKIAIW